MISKKIMTLVILSVFASSTYAKESKPLTLSEAISLTKANSKRLKLSRRQVEDAAFQIREAKNKHLPDLKISGQGNYLPNTMSLHSPLLNNSSGSPMPTPNYMLLGQAALSVPLFTGFKISNGVAVAKYNQQLQESNYASREDEIVMQTIEAFVSLYKSTEAQKVVEENLSRAKETVKNFEDLEKNGMVARNDLLRVQLQESNIELALAETKKNNKIINYNLDLLLGLPEDTEIVASLDFNYQPQDLSEGEYQIKALDNRNELKSAAIETKMAEKKIAIAKGDYYPTVAFAASWMDVDIHRVGQADNMTMIGLSVSYNLSSLFKNKSKVASAHNHWLQEQDNLDILNDQIKSQIHTAYEDYNYSVDKTKVYEKALEQANENYRIVENKQKMGLANTDDLLTADVEQMQASLNNVYGKADVLLAYYKLLKEAGVISQN